MIPTIEEMIQQYVSAWNNSNLEEFKVAFAECWAENATYTDPNYDLKGVIAIAELAQTSLELFPGRKFFVKIAPEFHHHVGRYTWKVILPEEEREGFDYFEFNDQHQITKIASFF